MIKKVPRLTLVFRLLIIILFVNSQAKGQEIKKVFTKDIVVSEGVTVVTKGPRNLDFEMHGRMDASWGESNYEITPGGNDGIPALFIRDYEVRTWEENKVRQTVEIVITLDDDYPNEGKKLMEELKMDLSETNGIVAIDDNLNLQKFGFVNGFLRSNTNTVSLDNGMDYRIKGVRIKASLDMPKSANLELTSKYVGLSIGDLDGHLKLDISTCTINAGQLQKLSANMNICKANFRDINEAVINSKNSKVIAGQISTLKIGSASLAGRSQYRCFLNGRGSNTSLSKFMVDVVDFLEVSETTNDYFSIGEVGEMQANYSTFSNYDIGLLRTELNIKAKNGDIKIDKIDTDFKSININNHVSSIKLAMANIPNYQVNIVQSSYTESLFPGEIELMETKAPKTYSKGETGKGGVVSIHCDSCKVIVEE